MITIYGLFLVKADTHDVLIISNFPEIKYPAVTRP